VKKKRYRLYNLDCFTVFEKIPDGRIDLVLVDLPYGITDCKWDSVIPLERMWIVLKRIVKSDGGMVFTASQPFTTTLIASNMELFKYCWVWVKSNPSNIAHAERRPLKYHEDIVVFYKSQPTYNKQMIPRMNSGMNIIRGYQKKGTTFKHGATVHCAKVDTTEYDAARYDLELKNPSSVLYFKSERCHPRLHPTQKPVPLMEHLIRTYTNEGEIVLDFAMGSGTTGVACGHLGRIFIGCDNDVENGYFDIAEKRIRAAYNRIQSGFCFEKRGLQ